MAGESARAIAADKRRRGQDLLREADLYDRGAEGEEATGRALAALPSDMWTVIHDVHWPGRPYANIDHVVIGPSGVYVIDSKHWRGVIRVANGVLHRGGKPHQKNVDAALTAALAIGSLVPKLDPRMVKPVLCFLTDAKISGNASGVRVCSTDELVSILLTQSHALTPVAREVLAQDLDAQLWPAIAPVPEVASTRAPVRLSRPRQRSTSRPRSRRTPSLLRLVPAALGVIALVAVSAHPEMLQALLVEVLGN